MIFILILGGNCLLFDAVQNISVWLRTGFNKADVNRFRSHTGKEIIDLPSGLNIFVEFNIHCILGTGFCSTT